VKLTERAALDGRERDRRDSARGRGEPERRRRVFLASDHGHDRGGRWQQSADCSGTVLYMPRLQSISASRATMSSSRL